MQLLCFHLCVVRCLHEGNQKILHDYGQKTHPLGVIPFNGKVIYNNEACKNAIEGSHESYPRDFRKI